MSNLANKKVTFKEGLNHQSKERPQYNINDEEEPFITLNDPSHKCPYEVPPDAKVYNPCLVEQCEGARAPKYMYTENLKKALPCTRGQLDKSLGGEPPMAREDVSKKLCPDRKGVRNNAITCPPYMDSSKKPENPAHSSHDGISAAQQLTDKIKEMVIEEEFRKENSTMRRQLFKYRGICGTLGNPVFTNTPVAPPEYQAKLPTRRVPGHPRPVQQHPLYYTTSADYGSSEPYLESTPIVFYPDDQSFTIKRAIGGTYEDAHLTTELDKDPMW